MKAQIRYVSDVFLEQFKTDFELKYLDLYRYDRTEEIKNIFNNSKNVISTGINFDFRQLNASNVNDDTVTIENIKTLWSSLKILTPAEAENEKLWVAMENTYYLEYHLKLLSLLSTKSKEESITSRTIFNHGRRRSLFINNLSLLWWIAYYLIDEDNKDDPYHLVEYFVKNSYRGNAVAFFSSSFVANKDLALGVIEAIMELTKEGKMIENRYSYSNANKILNQIGGVRILDVLTRDEVKQIIKDNLLDTAKIRIPN